MKHKEEQEKEKPADDYPQEESTEGVVIPEDFQQDVHNVLKKASSKHHLSHIKDRVYAKEDEMRQAEMAKKDKGKKVNKDGPDNFSTEGASPGMMD